MRFKRTLVALLVMAFAMISALAGAETITRQFSFSNINDQEEIYFVVYRPSQIVVEAVWNENKPLHLVLNSPAQIPPIRSALDYGPLRLVYDVKPEDMRPMNASNSQWRAVVRYYTGGRGLEQGTVTGTLKVTYERGAIDMKAVTPPDVNVKVPPAIEKGLPQVIKNATPRTPWAWGDNANGQLGPQGQGGTAHSQIAGLTGIMKIAAGKGTSYALGADGIIRAWGGNGSGQLGNGSTTSSSTPVQVSAITGVSDVTGNGRALKGGTVWAWGYNANGQLGNGTTGSPSTVPVQVVTSNNQPLTGIVAISGELALHNGGLVYAWGRNNKGQLGNGTTVDSDHATQVKDITSIRAIAAGHQFGVAVKTDNTVWAWGRNAHGQLGNRTSADATRPVQVQGLPTGSKVVKVEAGMDHVLALLEDGTVWAWGNNNSGQLGLGSNGAGKANSDVALRVNITGKVKDISAGDAHSLARMEDGTVWAWGKNDLGQLGYPTSAPSPNHTPSPVGGVTGAAAIAAGATHTLVIK